MKDQKRWDRESILAVSSAYWQGATLQAAVALDIFTALGKAALGAEHLARAKGWDSRSVETLLDALCAMGLLAKENKQYRITDEARTFLSKDSDQYIGYIIKHHLHLMERWAQLPKVVQTGRPVRKGPQQSKDQREAFLMGMFNIASLTAPRVAQVLDLSGKRRLLDLGGGPGTYAIHFCLANPLLNATIYDLPETRSYALKTVESFGLSGRISFQEGDYLDQEVPGTYDVVWMSHILHSLGPQTCQKVIAKAVAALDTGGVLYVHDFLLNEHRDGPLFPALFSLNMLVNTKEGRAYSEVEIRSMMKGAGLRDIERIPFESPNSSGILRGIV